MAILPIDKLLKALPTKLDPQNAAGLDIVLGVSYTNLDKGFTFHVRNSILAVTDGFPENPNMSISLDSNTHKLIVGGHLTILEAIDSAQVEYVGDPNKLHDFIELFDRLTVETYLIG